MRSSELIDRLPALRRHARAATGEQSTGDRCVAELIEHVDRMGVLNAGVCSKLSLHRKLAVFINGSQVSPRSPSEADRPKSSMPIRHRQALLLTGLEGLSGGDAAWVLGITIEEFGAELEAARLHLGSLIVADVLIIEDEFFISRDLTRIVTSMGHRVLARAKTHAEAIAIVAKKRPDLILADVSLADSSSGIEAVDEINKSASIPAIFITAYLEKLLTGSGPEPTFLIAKPYRVEEVKAVIAQSLLFTEFAVTSPMGFPCDELLKQ